MKRIEITSHHREAAEPSPGYVPNAGDRYWWLNENEGMWYLQGALPPDGRTCIEGSKEHRLPADALPRYRYEPEPGDECEALFSVGWKRIKSDSSVGDMMVGNEPWPGKMRMKPETPTAYRPIPGVTIVNGTLWTGEEKTAQPEPKPGDTRARHSMVPDPSCPGCEVGDLMWVCLKDSRSCAWELTKMQAKWEQWDANADPWHRLPRDTPQLAAPYDWDANGWPTPVAEVMKHMGSGAEAEPAAEPVTERGLPELTAEEIGAVVALNAKNLSALKEKITHAAKWPEPNASIIVDLIGQMTAQKNRTERWQSALATLAEGEDR